MHELSLLQSIFDTVQPLLLSIIQDSDDTVSKSSKDETSVSSSGLSLTDKEAKMIGESERFPDLVCFFMPCCYVLILLSGDI